MKISYELDLNSFKAWSGAVSTLDRIQREGKCEALESILDDLYPDGMTETELNDLLWFEPEQVYEWVGLRTEEQIQTEIDEAQERIDEINEEMEQLRAEYDDECIGIADWERAEIWEENHKNSWEELETEKAELEETIAELKEEKAEL